MEELNSLLSVLSEKPEFIGLMVMVYMAWVFRQEKNKVTEENKELLKTQQDLMREMREEAKENTNTMTTALLQNTAAWKEVANKLNAKH